MFAAASATRDSGRSIRRLVDHPKNVATSVARIEPMISAVASTCSVRSVVSSGNASKYDAS